MKPTRRFPVTRTRAMRPRYFLAQGAIKAKILEIQSELLAELREIDDQVQTLVVRRNAVVGELRRCRDAFGGVGAKHMRRIPLPTEVDAEPEGTREVTGRDLREAAAVMLASAGRAVTTSDLHRMLLASGLRVPGRYAKAISDALRPEVAAGRVVKIDRGIYAQSSRVAGIPEWPPPSAATPRT
jgi:hypothetical protein